MTMVCEQLTKEKIKEIIAKRAAKEFKDGDVVTLGIGCRYTFTVRKWFVGCGQRCRIP